MSALSIHNEIRTRFNTQWANAYPVAWPNVKYVPVIGNAYVRFSIRIVNSNVIDIGSANKTCRSLGIITIQIFAPKGKGDALALTMADTAASIFNLWCGVSVKCRVSEVKTIGEDDGDWYRVNVSVPFSQEETI